MKRIKQVSKEAYRIGKEEEWGEFECYHGYGIFNGEYPTPYGLIVADHIERIDIMDCWESDALAAKHAERYCKMKIIHDIPHIEEVFLDTPENRIKIMKQIDVWMEKFANTPSGLVSELKHFAEMEI